LSLREGVSLERGAEGEIVLQGPGARVTFKHIAPGLRAAIELLSGTGASEEVLAAAVLSADGPAGLPRLYYYLQRLAKGALLSR
jgi:hypothetical protein